MKKLYCLAIVFALLLSCVPALATDWSPTDAALAIIDQLNSGDFAEIAAQADPSIAAFLTADVLEQGWKEVAQAIGPFQSILDTAEAQQGAMQVIQLFIQHENGQQVTVVAFNEDGSIVSLMLQPMHEYEETPPLPLPEGALEEEIALRPGEADETSGTLVLPAGDGPYDAVILVHGSGASDRDEAVYGVKPFRDLAMGLASHGIASLRYDKYTFAHADLLKDPITIEQEYMLDMRDAVAMLEADERIGRIFLIGHSEGGMLMARMLEDAGEAVQGGVIMAGTPRSLWEVQLMQNEDALATMSEDDRAAMQPYLEAEVEKAKRLPSMSEEEQLAETIFSIPASYHLDLVSVDPIETLLRLEKPVLIMQGAKDFQVKLDIDMAAWISGLEGHPFVTFIIYNELTHLFIALEGESSLGVDDYAAGGHVDDQVITDIAEWIFAQE